MRSGRLSRRISKLLFLAIFVFGVCQAEDKGVRLPSLDAMLTIGAQAGREVEVSLLGDMLSNAESAAVYSDILYFCVRVAVTRQKLYLWEVSEVWRPQVCRSE